MGMKQAVCFVAVMFGEFDKKAAVGERSCSHNASPAIRLNVAE